jgi:hypothetical protein
MGGLCQAPFAGPEAVLAYLSRYTHRVAISNRRLVSMDENGVSFRWKDYRAKGRTRHKTMTLTADEFMRRFLLHVLPNGFHRIRHYGLLANAGRRENLAKARHALHAQCAPARTGQREDRRLRPCRPSSVDAVAPLCVSSRSSSRAGHPSVHRHDDHAACAFLRDHVPVVGNRKSSAEGRLLRQPPRRPFPSLESPAFVMRNLDSGGRSWLNPSVVTPLNAVLNDRASPQIPIG